MLITLQGGRSCYCGNSFANFGHVMTTGCNAPCNGDPQVNCGGFRKNAIYVINGMITESHNFDETLTSYGDAQ